MLSQIRAWGGIKISCYLLNFGAKILPDDIHTSNQSHAHPCHHLLTCPDDDDQWFWVGHLAHVMSHAVSDLCDEGLTKISCDLLPNF